MIMADATLFLLLFRFFLFLKLIIDYDKKVHSVKNEFLDTGVKVSLIRLNMNYLDEEKTHAFSVPRFLRNILP